MDKPILQIIYNILIQRQRTSYNKLRNIYNPIINNIEYDEYFQHLNKYGLYSLSEDKFNFIYYKLKLTSERTTNLISGIDINK